MSSACDAPSPYYADLSDSKRRPNVSFHVTGNHVLAHNRSAILLGIAATAIGAGCLALAWRVRSAGRHADDTAATTLSMWHTVDGLRLHARVAGAAHDPPVVCVHGLGVSSRYFGPAQARLARTFRVYAPDLPGSGLSEAPPHVLDIPEMATVLAGWMRATGLEHAAFIGNSMGCQVIAELATQHPQLVERAVFNAPTMDPHARTALAQALRLLRVAPRERPSQLLLAAHDYLESGIVRSFRTYRHALRDRIEEKLPRMMMPVLIVRGGRDPIVSQRWVEEATALLPDGRLRVLPDVPHAAPYSAPDELTAAIVPFLKAGDA